MVRFSTLFTLLVFLNLAGFSLIASEDMDNFDLATLTGKWEGNGEVLIPKVSIPVEIEGKAVFTYDSVTQKLRTSLEARRFFFTYVDSGYLWHDPETDSITWEIWDGFGKYCFYSGKIENNVITGTQSRKGRNYFVEIDMITKDSLSFRLSTAYPNGKTKKRADIKLWRVE